MFLPDARYHGGMLKRIANVLTLVLVGLIARNPASGREPLHARHGMVVTVEPHATEAGLSVLKNGGNAVDAAVAVGFALAVTHPAAGNLGGGGFMLVRFANGRTTFIDFRERAPAKATPTMYLGKSGIPTTDSNVGYLASGVPGTVRGLELAHKRFGKLPWKQVVEPAVKLAADGFPLEPWSASSLNALVDGTAGHPELQRVFGKAGGTGSWTAGDRFVQPDLARTLRLIADQGADAFYTGPVADLIAAEMRAGKGLITKDDLAAYKAVEREPVHTTYRGYDVFAPPPPSAGGTSLVEMLNVLETFDLKKHGRYAPETVHLMTEAMRRAFCDRARYLGDPAFTAIPAELTTKDYARKLAAGIDPKRATPSADLARDIPLADAEGDTTTHFSVVDKDGMAVANTYTLENSYGSRVVVRGAGFLLNNEMTDFNLRPGVTTRRGAVGTPPNQIAPGKRMVSSQTPTILARDGKALLVTGSPGSRTIPNTVLCVVLNVVDFGMDVQAAVDAPRQHHQWFPDELRTERLRGYPDVVDRLTEMGHRVVGERSQGDAHTIQVDPKTGTYRGAADHRIMGKAAGY
jgi:gamma-glutamyltranspeptidase/glutathione hydrolase